VATTSAVGVERVEALRVPALPSAAALDSKDWYHVVLLHAASGWRAIANVNLDGSGGDAVLEWTLVVHAPGEPSRLYGTSRSQTWRPGMVQARPLAILGNDVSYGFDGQQIALRIAPRDLDLRLDLVARPTATPLLVSDGAPFGSGYFGWGILPVLQAEGEISACGRSDPIDSSWFCYHDHNFGRFRWGEDFGWEWLVAHAVGEGGEPMTFIADWRTDRAHTPGGLLHVYVVLGGKVRKIFLGPAVRLRWHWHDEATLPARLPGTMATLLADRPVRRPRAIVLDAADERDRLQLTVDVDAYFEVIAPDSRSSAATRIGETSGPATVELRLANGCYAGRGLAYAEYTR
jgi:hypothetical protein